MELTKHADKHHIIRYKRDDGSETWMNADDYFVRHDLSHYAVEKILNYTTAFMGMISQGMDIRDFEQREKRKNLNITEQAWYAENMANLFLIDIMQGKFEDFNSTSQMAFGEMKLDISPPVLDEKEIDEIRNFLEKLLRIWKELPDGKQIILEF